MAALLRWAPATLMATGALFTVGLDLQRVMPLAKPLAAVIPETIGGYSSRDLPLSEGERRVAGASDYLLRAYAPIDTASSEPTFSLFIGYYDQQSQGKTIHSPKNCLPGSGWEVLASRTDRIDTAAGREVVNRYVLQRGDDSALVLYWYQGRGRIQANEYLVKWELLRDSALKGRSEEALVRIVVPITETEDAAFRRAAPIAALLMRALSDALPP